VPLGRFADRVGPKRVWAAVALIEAALFLVWPWLEGFWQFLAMVVVLVTFPFSRYSVLRTTWRSVSMSTRIS